MSFSYLDFHLIENHSPKMSLKTLMEFLFHKAKLVLFKLEVIRLINIHQQSWSALIWYWDPTSTITKKTSGSSSKLQTRLPFLVFHFDVAQETKHPFPLSLVLFHHKFTMWLWIANHFVKEFSVKFFFKWKLLFSNTKMTFHKSKIVTYTN